MERIWPPENLWEPQPDHAEDVSQVCSPSTREMLSFANRAF